MAKKRTNARIEWLLAQLMEQGYRLDQRGSASQLAYSSFDSAPGAGIKETDPVTGNIVANYGTQFDGTHGTVVFTGPIPPTPTPAMTRPGTGTLAAGWDGVFVNPDGVKDYQIIPPFDWTHVEVHVSQDADFTAEFADTLIGTINTARGGWVAAVTGPGVFYVRLVSRTSAGKKSPASAPVAVSVEGFNTDALRDEWEAADAALNSALTQNAQQQQQLANTMNTLQNTTLPGLSSDLAGAKTRLTAAEGTITSTTNLATATSADLTAATGRLTAAESALLTKGTSDVIYSPTAPAAALRKATTMWIDTSGTPPLNTPKRWTTGTTWVAITDKAVVDAAAAAATAKAAADAAQAAAEAAAATAGSAVTLANGKNTRTFSTASPASTNPGRDGDVWSRRDTNGRVVENWLHNGTTWTTYQLADGALSNLDVGKLTAGSATIISAVAAKIAAGTAAIQTADIGNLFVTGNSSLNTLTAQRIAANVGAYLELSVGQLTAGSASLGTAVADKLFSEIFSTRKLTAEQVLIGDGNRIADPEFLDDVVTGNRLSNNSGWTWVDASGGNPAAFRRVLTTAAASAGRFDFWTGPQPLSANRDFAGMVPVKAGERIVFFGFVSNTITTTWTWSVTGWNPTTSAITNVSFNPTSRAAGKNFVRGEYTVPAGVTHLSTVLLATSASSSSNTITIWGGVFARKMGGEPLALFADTNVSNVPYDLKITVAARNVLSVGAGDEKVPGLWFSDRKKDQTDVPPAVEPGVVSTGAVTAGTQIHSSAMVSPNESDWSKVFADPANAGIEVRRGPFESLPARGHVTVTPTTFNLYNTDPGVAPSGKTRAGISHAGDGVLQLTGDVAVSRGFTFNNGKTPFVDGQVPTWTLCGSLLGGFTHHTAEGWQSLRWARWGPIVMINGAVARSSAWSGSTAVWNLPVGMRPAALTQGTFCQATPTQLLLAAGSTAISISIMYFAVA